jgi:hypothetical protein
MAAIFTYALEELFKAAFTVGSVPMLYNENKNMVTGPDGALHQE